MKLCCSGTFQKSIPKVILTQSIRRSTRSESKNGYPNGHLESRKKKKKWHVLKLACCGSDMAS